MFKKLALLFFTLLMSYAFSQEFQTPIDLSIPGESATNPQIAFDGSGNGICVWQRYENTNQIIQAARTTDGGATFSTPIDLGIGTDPQIAFDSSGHGVCVWQGQGSSIHAARTTDGGATFSTPVNLSAETGLYPQIAFDSSGNGVCVWKGISSIQAARTTDGGATFSTPITLSGSNVNHPQIAFDPISGNGVCVWYIYDGGFIIQAAQTTNGGASFSTPINLSNVSPNNAAGPQIAFDNSGHGVCVWYIDNIGTPIVQAAQTTNGGASFSTPIDLFSGLGGDSPQIAFDSSGHGVCVWTRYGANHIVQAAQTTNGGASFSTPINLSIAGQNADFPQISLDSSGNGVCVWERSDGSNTIIQAAQTTDGGASFSTPIDLSLAGQNAHKPQIAIDGSGNEVAVWYRSNGLNDIIQAASAAELLPPVTFSVSGSQFKTSGLFQTDIANKISWNTISSATSYKVYDSNNALLFQGLEPFYFEHGKKQGKTYQYFVTWVNSLGVESAPVAVSIP